MKRTVLLIATLAATACVSVDEIPVNIDVATAAEIPVSRATALLNAYAMPEEAARLIKRRKEVEAAVAQRRCVFGARSTRVLSSGAMPSNDTLRFVVMRLSGAASVGEQDGVNVHVRHGDSEQTCLFGFFPDSYPESALQQELRRLATAAAVIGIRQSADTAR